jgi:hypothetical protein
MSETNNVIQVFCTPEDYQVMFDNVCLMGAEGAYEFYVTKHNCNPSFIKAMIKRAIKRKHFAKVPPGAKW